MLNCSVDEPGALFDYGLRDTVELRKVDRVFALLIRRDDLQGRWLVSAMTRCSKRVELPAIVSG